MKTRSFALSSILVLVLLAAVLGASTRYVLAQTAESQTEEWPRTVLVTNDDGIDQQGMVALARAFSQGAETYVVAPLHNCSGSADYVSLYSKHVLEVQERDLGPGIKAYGVDGYPGDCVVLALRGLMNDHAPDLVVSGINGGPNLGDDWLASGTIGAARIAASLGVPAIAVSGLDESAPEAAAAAAEWVVRLAHGKLVRDVRAGQYLTVSLPRTPPSEFKGVRVAERAGMLFDLRLGRIPDEASGDGVVRWALQIPRPIAPTQSTSDAALYQAGYVVIVPMRADEHDRELLSRLLQHPETLPGMLEPERRE
jgi:5'-nucleotidase